LLLYKYPSILNIDIYCLPTCLFIPSLLTALLPSSFLFATCLHTLPLLLFYFLPFTLSFIHIFFYTLLPIPLYTITHLHIFYTPLLLLYRYPSMIEDLIPTPHLFTRLLLYTPHVLSSSKTIYTFFSYRCMSPFMPYHLLLHLLLYPFILILPSTLHIPLPSLYLHPLRHSLPIHLPFSSTPSSSSTFYLIPFLFPSLPFFYL
jgi:hypothetical protein